METNATTTKPVSPAKRRQKNTPMAKRLIEAGAARAVLLQMLSKGQRVYVEQTYTSRSGDTRRYRVLAILRNDICDITRLTARAILRDANDHGIKIRGGSFSGEREIAEDLARSLYGEHDAISLGRI